jgi:hypothetical protein
MRMQYAFCFSLFAAPIDDLTTPLDQAERSNRKQTVDAMKVAKRSLAGRIWNWR